MTAEHVFKLYRAYKFFYDGKDIFRDGKIVLKHPPFEQQHDRNYFYRISQKLNDGSIHALFTLGFFYHPRAHVSDFVSPDAFSQALAFASRYENGAPLFRAEFHELAKILAQTDLDGWLYGERNERGERALMPGCLQAVVAGQLQADSAALLLLVPQKELNFNWPTYWSERMTTDSGLGPVLWIDRLKRLDQLVNMNRPAWRTFTWTLAKEFWTSLNVESLAPREIPTASLF